MNDLESKGKQRNTSRRRGKRFLTALDMAEIKRLEAVNNSRVKRGEAKPHTGICSCGCGFETCAFLYGTALPSVPEPVDPDPRKAYRARMKQMYANFSASGPTNRDYKKSDEMLLNAKTK